MSQKAEMIGSSKNSQYSSTLPSPDRGGCAVTDVTPSAVSCALSADVGWPGMTVVYDFPLISSPAAVVFEPLAPFPKVTVLTL
jgi:hypothetical protein